MLRASPHLQSPRSTTSNTFSISFCGRLSPDLFVYLYTHIGFLALHGQRRSRTLLDGAFRSGCRLLTQYISSLQSTIYNS